MFFRVRLQKCITVPPEALGATLHRRIREFLQEAVEGKTMPPSDDVLTEYKSGSKSSAVIVAVLDLLDLQNTVGKVIDNGTVTFVVVYDALVFKLFPGEVLDCPVVRMGADGFWCSAYGIGDIFVNRYNMSNSKAAWRYENDGGDGYWAADAGNQILKNEDIVRIQIISETAQSVGALAVATMEYDFLGRL